MNSDPIASFLDAMRSAGLGPTSPIQADGKLHRFTPDGDARGSDNGWYVLHLDSPPSGAFGSWKTGQNEKWTANPGRELSVEEREQLKRRMEADRQRRIREEEKIREEAAKRAAEIWSSANPCPTDHPYLTRKQIFPHITKVHEGLVTVPVTSGGKLVGLQFISEDGTKRFLTGTPKRGAYSTIAEKPTKSVIICEGFATAASIFEATGIPVVVAFDAGNLEPVALAIRERLGPDALIIIAADDDRWTDKNPGITRATEAAAAVNATLRRPIFRPGFEGKPTDFNDLAVLCGLDEVKHQIETGKPTAERLEKLPAVGGQINVASVVLEPFPDSNGKGKPLATIENLRELMRRLGVIARYNEISKEEEILIPDGAFSVDNQANASFAWILSWCNRAKIPTGPIGDYVTFLADQNPYNPVATWITSKPWDRRSRLEEFFATVTAVGEKSDPGVRAMKETFIKRWLVSAVAAAFRPQGVSAHGVLVFQGEQYLGKTAWFKRLAPPELNILADGMMLKADDRDSVKQIVSYWLVELGELDATFRRTDIAQLKSFLTRDKDVLRRAYARKESNYARRTVFFASVNPKEFLHDSTGNRRYWTIECEAIDYAHTVDMQQLWAEVYELYRSGESWYLQSDEMGALNAHNQNFEVVDPIEEKLARNLDWEASTGWRERTVTEVLEELGIQRPSHRDRVVAGQYIQKKLGRDPRKTNGRRVRSLPPLIVRDKGGSTPWPWEQN